MWLRRWDAAAERGALRTSPAGARWRVLPGDLRLMVTFNPLHRANKRPVATELASAAAASDAGEGHTPAKAPAMSGFNFTMAKPCEFLGGLQSSETVPAELTVQQTDENGSADEHLLPRHAVLVNVSPLMRGHSLFVFDINALHPQALTFEMLRLAFGVGRLMEQNDFSLGFNSAGAWSSVNHCHFQGYWMGDVAQHTGFHEFPVAQQPREVCFYLTVGGIQVSISRPLRWPVQCFAIELGPAHSDGFDEAVVKVTWALIRLLQTQGIPHNLLLTWYPRLVAFVFPRQPQQENGVGKFPDGAHQLRFAIAEVAGLVVTSGEIPFNAFTQSICEDIMRQEVSLDEVSFSGVMESFRMCELI